MIKATQRVVPVVLLSATLIIVGTVLEPSLLLLGLALFLFVASMKGLTTLEYMAASRIATNWRVKGSVEGEEIIVELDLVNNSWVPIVFAEASFNYSPFLRLVQGSRAALIALPPKGRVIYRAVLRARTGRHLIGPVKFVIRDPFGLYRSPEVVVSHPIILDIRPRTSEVVVRRLFAYTRSTGLTKARDAGLGVEFYDTRDYRPGDEIRWIDWKKLASMNRLVVKEFERETFQTVLFLVDATPYTTQGPYGNTPFEHMARVVASISRYLGKRGDLVGLVVFDHRKVISTGKLYRGSRAFYEVLKTLSMVEYSSEGFTESNRAEMLVKAFGEIIKMLPRERNAVFLFTSSWSEESQLLVKLVKKLSALNSTVYVVVPIITAYEVKELPTWARAVYRVKAYDRLKKDIEFATRLRKLGVKVVSVGPEHIPQAIVAVLETLAH